jgi:hypothetical protein
MCFERLVLALALVLAAASGLTLGGAGCSNPPCIRHSDCNVGLICGEAGVCVQPPDAAPEEDAGEHADAGPDATPGDASTEPDADETIEEPDASPDGAAPDGAP